jgi:beta-phosphoglucomutase
MSLKFPLNAVIFDMDGVITNTMPYHYRAWNQIFREEGFRVPPIDIYKREGQKGIESIREIFAEYGKPFSLAHGRGILRHKEQLFKKIAQTRFIPGACNFIVLLQKRRIPLALVTGTARHEVKKIIPTKILSAFKVIVSGTDVTNGKPHPEPYLKAIKILRIPKNKIVVIENAPFGILSAKVAGLTCLALETSLPRKYLSQADRVFHGFEDLSMYFIRNYGL